MKNTKIQFSRFLVALLALLLMGSSLLAAVSTSKQLEKAKQLFAEKKDSEAMDLFVDVMVSGSRTESDEANKYINLIHNRMAGIEAPVEVSEDFQEGIATRIQTVQDPAVLEQQLAAQATPVVQETTENVQYAADRAQAEVNRAQAEVNRIQDEINRAQEQTKQQIDRTQAEINSMIEEPAVRVMQYNEQEYDPYADPYTELRTDSYIEQYANPYPGPYATSYEEYAAQEPLLVGTSETVYVKTETKSSSVTPTMQAPVYAAVQEQSASVNSTYVDLTSPEALKARQLYTEQKIDSMTKAALARLEKQQGVRVYMRNGMPDAIDIDSDVLFNGYKFRPEAYEVLDDVYALMALTQGAGYVILPPGSYTDNITLPGIRQAMALNSYLVHKGLSSGKLSYNMGLYDQEPPAKFANLEGLSIVFDYDAQLPASLPDAAAITKLPLLSMAVVPVSLQINPCEGEAFVVDFSALETANGIENWVFQIIQHGADGQYYVVRQLEGFAPVYHQFLWNARKGVIGPALPCGKYTFTLTAKDVKGGTKTLRRLVEVKCCGTTEGVQTKTKAAASKLNYKAARLWKKPGRVMKSAASSVRSTVVTVEEPEIVDPFAAANSSDAASRTEITTKRVYRELADGSVEERTTTTTTTGSADSAAASARRGTAVSTASADTDVTNPYDMPYDSF